MTTPEIIVDICLIIGILSFLSFPYIIDAIEYLKSVRIRIETRTAQRVQEIQRATEMNLRVAALAADAAAAAAAERANLLERLVQPSLSQETRLEPTPVGPSTYSLSTIGSGGGGIGGNAGGSGDVLPSRAESPVFWEASVREVWDKAVWDAYVNTKKEETRPPRKTLLQRIIEDDITPEEK